MVAVVGEDGGAARVSDDEEVARLCFKADFPVTHDGQHPSEIDAVGMYRLEEFQWKDFSKPERGGFSVQRTSLFTRADAQRVLEDRIRKKVEREKRVDGYDLEGVVTAGVHQIHGIRDGDGESAFVVTPEPVDGNPAHAAIRVTNKIGSGPFLKYRKALQDVFGQVRPLEALRED